MAENTDTKRLILPYLVAVGFIATSINSIAKGIDNHETWRVVIASVGGAFFVGVAALMAVRLIKNSRQRNDKQRHRNS